MSGQLRVHGVMVGRVVIVALFTLLCAGCAGPPTGPAAVVEDSPTSSAGRTARATPAAEPVTRDATGQQLPARVADAVQRVHAGLRRGDLTALTQRHRPKPDAPSRERTMAELRNPAARTALAQTLRTPPTVGPDGDVLYSHGNYGVGLASDGTITYIGAARPGG